MQKKWILAVLLLFHFFLLINLRFEAWPSMILHPWLMSRGFLLYQDIIEPYLPLLPYFLRIFFSLVGFTIVNLKIFTWALILLIDFLVYFLALKIWQNRTVAFSSLAFFIFWQPFLDGNGLWFDLATTPFLLLSCYFFFKFFLKNLTKNLILSGLFLGLAFFIKQTTFWFYLLLAAFLLLQKNKTLSRKIVEAICLCLPLLGFLILAVFYFSFKNNLSDFLFWTLKFPFFILSRSAGHKELPNLRQAVLTLVPFLPLLCFLRIKIKREVIRKNSLLLLWLIPALSFILPRWGLFHLQPALAFLSLILGPIFFSGLKRKFSKGKSMLFLAMLLVSLTFQIRFFLLFWRQETRFFETEVLRKAVWLKKNSNPDDKIFNLSGLDQLFFLADRLPPKPWAINFSWFYETGDLKKQVLRNLEKEQPEIIIYQAPLEGKKLSPGVYQPEEIKKWILKNYKPCFKIEDTQFLKKNEI